MSHFQVGSFVRPCDGEAVAGDASVVKELSEGVFLCLIDALGHGREAAEVALLAIRFLKQNSSSDVAQILRELNEHLAGTRGAMVGIAFADNDKGTVSCTGLGNAVIRRLGNRGESFPSPDGIVGVRFRTPRVSRFQLGSDDLLLMHSDGIDDSLFNESAPSLWAQPVDAIARRIVLDHGRQYDDAACLIVRYQP
jgi:negative regulator of sigma-B (phosphoserine phosphatase)